jgi:dTDP-4-dehydrorhamnose 3,5-epimerase-like enzyme
MIEIKPLQHKNTDDRGSTYTFDNQRAGECIMAYRKAGSISGRHYHEGKSPQKNPEILILISGQFKLLAIHMQTYRQTEYVVEAPVEVIIQPFVWHEITALTDIYFIELNSIAQHAADTFYNSPQNNLKA